MDKDDYDNQLRRTLPSAPPPQRPTTPISTAAFYGDPAQNPPPLPYRPSGVGSKSTTYTPAAVEPLQRYDVVDYREPELIREERIDDIDEEMPALTSNNDWGNNQDWINWESNSNQGDWGNTSIQRGPTPYPGQNSWSGGIDDMTWFNDKPLNCGVAIDGREDAEELSWWNAEERKSHARPGPGMLPPILADQLHDPDHTLFSVVVTPPEGLEPPPEAPVGTLNASSSPPSTSSPSSKPKVPPPTPEDVRTAVPHPSAYYCPQDNGWVIISWRTSAVLPTLAQSFLKSGHPHPIPDHERRLRVLSCVSDDEQNTSGSPNKTHHFHKYPKAIDGLKLQTPFRRNEWEANETKHRRRAGTIITEDLDLDKMKTMADEDGEKEEEGILLDLYMCCQCQLYCVASEPQPGVISSDHWGGFIKEKLENPSAGMTPQVSVLTATETLLVSIENLLWKSELRALRVARPGFNRKIGWTPTVQSVFQSFGFMHDESDSALRVPSTETTSAIGRHNRAKLLRVWVEINAWVGYYKKKNHDKFKDHSAHRLWVTLDNAREMIQTAIGAHHDQISRGNLNETLQEPMKVLSRSFNLLGLSVMSYSPELLTFAYLAQCRCDPAQTVEYFSALTEIVSTMERLASCPSQLQDLLLCEQNRGRFLVEDILKAPEVLGFGLEGPLCVEYDHDVEEEFVENAWKECVKRSWLDPAGGELQRNANEALRILAESRGSTYLRSLYDKGKNSLMMTPDRAYDVLEVPRETDDAMLITVFSMRLEEQPTQMERMQEALSVIAEIRNSWRLQEFIRTSRDPGESAVVIPPDFPRGLDQLGNTCYLNSLLQFLYTIKDLREALIPLIEGESKSTEDKLSDGALSKHRVGGRLVTRREVQRSKRFVSHLAELFRDLASIQTPSIKPAIELAKLALVTSKDEEEDEIDNGGTDSSNDTDATLVEDGPSNTKITADRESQPPIIVSTPPQSPTRSLGSILGKRTRGPQRRASEMDVDVPSSPITSTSRASSVPESTSSSTSSTTPEGARDEDVEMMDLTPVKKQPPALPPRKTPVKSDSVMMFGRQHDVAECMDNCMFQIETAFLEFDEMSEPSDDDNSNSIVKQLFYGKIRQQFVETVKGQPTTHTKEDLFSHLPVNVSEEGFDIYEGLGRYFDDTIEYEGQKVPIEISLMKLPPVLQIQLQRVQFNRELVQSWKCQAYVKFGETIYMDRFMDTADPEKRRQSKALQDDLLACRERIRLLVSQGQNSGYASVLSNLSAFLTEKAEVMELCDIEMDDELPVLLSDASKTVDEEIEELRARITQQKAALEDIWKDEKNVPYELTSVFIHRGNSPQFGHYFFYSRNLPSKPDEWFKYNDSDVSMIDKEDVLKDTTGDTANPYLLVFARKGHDIVDTVKRTIPDVPDS